MGTPFLSEVRIFSFNFAPRGWALCNGQVLPINQNQALFSLIGTYYGGNGTTTFQLPNLQGSMAVHMGNDGAGNVYELGQKAGEASVTLLITQIPAHKHQASGVSNTANEGSPVGDTWAASVDQPYGPSPGVAMNAASVALTGGGQPHTN
ncbi:MAG: tail fiber protein, partial [Terracidiphilus sp.]